MNFPIKAYHTGERFDLSRLDTIFSHQPIRFDNTFRLYQFGDSYLYFKDFGAVISINGGIEKQHELIELLGTELEQIIDTFSIQVDPGHELKVDFDKIIIPEMDLDLLHIICLNLAQSLALDQYQHEVDILLEKTRIMTFQLSQTGKVQYAQRKLARFIGEIMNLRNRMADNLYIFESPPLAWKDQRLSEMDEILNHELDFGNRHRAIQHSLLVVRDNHEFFNNLLQHKHSSLLEWIIIILILFEVVHIFIK